MTAKLNRLTLSVATIALAGVFAFSPSFVPVPGDMDGAAYAQGKSGDKGNKGGGNRGGGKDKGNKGGGNKSAKNDKGGKPAHAGGKKKVATQETMLASADGTGEYEELHPSQKGKWNAANANQAALDAHMRNGNYNGTIGALTQYQLATKAATDYEGLSELEKSALDSFDLFEPVDISDEELAGVLNEGAMEGDPEFQVVDGMVSCSANCPEGDALTDLETNAQGALDDYVSIEQELADQQAIDDFYTASEERIINESNKPTEGIEDQLLDNIAKDLGVERPAPEDEMMDGEDDMAAIIVE